MTPSPTPSPTRHQTLRALAAKWHAASREEFVAAHGWPFLLLAQAPVSDDFDEHETWRPAPGTPHRGVPIQSTTVSNQSPLAQALAYADSIVVPVQKTDKNAFADMFTVGRATNNDLALPVLTVSKLHGYFRQDGGRWRFHDADATNGTWVARRRLSTREIVDLSNGVEIHFGPDAQALFMLPEGLHAILRVVAKKG